MPTIRWGIVGVGNVTEVKSGPAFQKAQNSALVAVMRRTASLAQDYARRHGVPRWYDDAAALIDDPQVDAVYVATPPSTHQHYTLMAARAGKPVYVEKPMALNHAQCQAMIEGCRAMGVPLYVAFYRRALARFLKIKELVDQGAIGQVRFVSITLAMPLRPEEMDRNNLPWRVLPEVAGGGRFVDLAAHQLDFLDFLLGPVRSAQGFAANQGGLYPAEDIVSGAFVFRSGVHGTGTWCFTAGEERDLTSLTGTEGTIEFSFFGATPVVLSTPAGAVEFPISYPQHVQQPLIQTVVDALLGQGSCPSTGESGARTSWVMDQLLQDYYVNQRAQP